MGVDVKVGEERNKRVIMKVVGMDGTVTGGRKGGGKQDKERQEKCGGGDV